MNVPRIICAMALAITVGVFGEAGDKSKPVNPSPPHAKGLFFLFPLDLNRTLANGKPQTTNVEIGDLVQCFAISDRSMQGKFLHTLKVEIKGDAVEMLGIVETPLRLPPNKSQPNGQADIYRCNLSCFVRAAKKGSATIKITPVGIDGKDQPTREEIISVYPR